MKKVYQSPMNRFRSRFFMLIILMVLSLSGFSQNVGINTTGSAPNANAGLDVDFPDKGVLIPRLALTSTSSFAPLSAHVAGMLVYNTATSGDVMPGFYYNNGSAWIPGFPAANTTGNMLYWNGSAWMVIPVGVPGQYLQLNSSLIPVWGGSAQYATITTTAVSAVTDISATSGGNITNTGGSPTLSRGVCWNTTGTPTIADSKTTNGSGTGSFTSNLTGLTLGVTYYVRAYAINNDVISYGNEISFTTTGIIPTLAATPAATAIGQRTATTGGNVISSGGSAISERGICYATTTGPTTASTKIIDPSPGLGSFVSNLTGLSASTTYYVRSYAINITGTAYGSEISFTTLAPITPVLAATTAATSITLTSATSGGNVTSDGGATVTERGVCYGTTSNPTTAGLKVVDSAPGTGSFSSNLTGLSAGTGYYVRAYAINSIGTNYGTQASFTTLSGPPTLVTVAATGITGSLASSGGSMNWNGGGYSNFNDYGVAYSTTPGAATPTYVATNTSNGAVNPLVNIGPWTTNLTGLAANTTYYIRAYLNLWRTSTSSWITVFGNELSFTTATATAPIVASTSAVTVTSANNATSGGTISSDGGSAITAKGVCWSTSASPVLGSGNFTSNGTGTAGFTSSVAGLIGSTTYYLRAYATNSIGTSYGPTDLTFTTWIQAPFALYQNTGYGVVMYVAPDGTGFMVSPDISLAGAGWGCSGTSIATGTALGTGKANTDLILASCADRPIAASIARAYTGGGYNDWYLPSNGEWAIIASYPNYIWAGLGTLLNIYYTSSQTSTTATGGYFSNSSQTYSMGAYKIPATYTNYIRAIRDFAPPVAPTVTTTAITGITGITAVSGGDVTSDGGAALTGSGVCWSTIPSPTTADSKTSDGTATGVFVSNITGLSLGTTYFVRAYATNSVGTSYGTEFSFSTLNIPTLTTTAAYTIAGVTASSGGNVTSDGGATVTVRGVCWSTATGPTTVNSKTSNGTGTGSFTSALTGLTIGTTYYIRAYATNAEGTAYGNEVTFTTLNAPTVTTTAISPIGTTTATSGGTITTNGGSTVTVRGVCWSTTTSPTTALTTKTASNGSGTPFTSNITGLTAGVTYYVRAYATNIYGTAYGNELIFTTHSVATVTTSPVTVTPPTTAASGGNVTYDGGVTVTARGVCWGTSTAPTTALSTKTSNGSGTGVFTSALTGLVSGTTYYIRAYVTNSVGTAYGNEIIFIEGGVATVSTTAVTSIAVNTATSGGTVNSDGGSTVSARGVCWNTSATPTIALSTKTNDGTGTGIFVSSITGLTQGTLYYVRAYATNTTGTAYGTQTTFTTLTTSAPTVTTTAITAIGTTVATSGGNVISDGNSAVTARGVCWSTSVAPTIASSLTSDGTGTGAFVSSITGLTPGTTYYVRAYATNSINTSYGTQLSFTSTALPPTVTTDPVTFATSSGGTSGGNITSNGGVAVTARGVCWSTTTGPTTVDSKTTDGTGTGAFVSNITGLTAGLTYYIRAYATNSGGTGYGNEEVFMPIGLPTVATLPLSYIALDPTASSGVSVTSDGGDPLIALGIVWGTTSGPTVALNLGITAENIINGWYQSSTITGVVQGTTYYIRAYATNGLGTSYGPEISFTPGVLGLATVLTGPVVNKIGSIAEVETNILSDGGDPVLTSGICWGTSLNPTVVSNPNMTVEYVPLGLNYSIASNLSIGTTYHVRAYATNNTGTAYGADISFVATAATINQLITGGWLFGNVFNVDGTGLHGLFAQNYPNQSATDWGCSTFPAIGTTGTGIGTGLQNTTDIINNITIHGCVSSVGTFAALLTTYYGTGFYLPSKDELNLMWTNRVANGLDPGFVNAVPATFWSSSEIDASHAWSFDSTTGTWSSALKTDVHNFWAIRSF